MNSRRLGRINEVIRRELALVLSEELPEDFGMITVSDVQTSPDLKNAKVFISIVDSNKSEKIISYLNKHSFNYMKRISPRIRFKYLPNLLFQEAKASQNLQRISDLLDQIKKENKQNGA